MPHNVYSAVLEIDTRFVANHHAQLGVTDKLAYLRRSLGYAKRTFRAMNNGVDPSVANGDILIFAAPEYFFGHSQFDGQACSVHAYSTAQAMAADVGCVTISTRYPEFLIVPGTVLYKEEIDRAQRGQLHQQLQQGKTIFQPGGRMRTEITQQQARIVPKGYGIKSRFMTRLRAIGYNQARVYYNGARVYTLNKIDNASEFVNEPGGRPILIGGTSSGTFTHPAYPAVTMGVEICADSGRIEDAQEMVDILILVSASVQLNNGYQPVNQRGLAIHANATAHGFAADPSGMRRIKAPNTQGHVFDRAATTTKLQQARTDHAVRCQMKQLG